ncbi:MAG TPA: CHAD domain-containing protein [Thermoanaerobaculia bacterium]|nr:CHAD domain-containing protein [Thermoanaerobaculia bacterium]
METPRSSPALVAHLAAAVSAQRARIEEVLARAERLDDERVLHDLRVALRRTASVAKLTRGFPAAGSGDPLRRTARELRRFLSPHRTLEVSVARLETRFRRDPARHAVALKLAKRIAPAPGDAAPASRDGHLLLMALRAAFSIRDAELARFSRPFAAVLPTRTDERLARTVRRRLRKRRKSLLAAGVPERDTLHALRIAAKDLRYGLEFVRDLVPGVPGLLKEFQRFQDVAGDAHDRIELIHVVGEAAAAGPPALRRGARTLVVPLERDAALALRRAQAAAGTLLRRLSQSGIEWT